MVVVNETDRTYPLKRPLEHKVPVPRWTLKSPDEVTHIYTLYVGVQCRSKDKSSASQAEQWVQEWLDGEDGRPIAVDILRVTDGFDIVDSKVWVAYWIGADGFTTKLRELNLLQRWNALGDNRWSVGLWCEQFITPRERLETNYASLNHKPGISQVPDGEFPTHNLTAYWGAGRDRIPASAHDIFAPPEDAQPPDGKPDGVGEHLTGSNYDNMCHIRKYFGTVRHWIELIVDQAVDSGGSSATT